MSRLRLILFILAEHQEFRASQQHQQYHVRGNEHLHPSGHTALAVHGVGVGLGVEVLMGSLPQGDHGARLIRIVEQIGVGGEGQALGQAGTDAPVQIHVEVGQRVHGVGVDRAAEAPLLPEHVDQQGLAASGPLRAHAVEGAHDGGAFAVLEALLKALEVDLPQGLLGGPGAHAVGSVGLLRVDELEKDYLVYMNGKTLMLIDATDRYVWELTKK